MIKIDEKTIQIWLGIYNSKLTKRRWMITNSKILISFRSKKHNNSVTYRRTCRARFNANCVHMNMTWQSECRWCCVAVSITVVCFAWGRSSLENDNAHFVARPLVSITSTRIGCCARFWRKWLRKRVWTSRQTKTRKRNLSNNAIHWH